MARFQYPGNLDKHPVITRISIFKRLNDVSTSSVTGAIGRAAQSILVSPKAESLHTIYLYTPTAVTFADGLAYDNIDFNNAVSTALSAADQASQGAFAGMQESVKAGLSNVVSDRAGSGGNLENAAAAATIAAGRVRNPRTQMLFKAPALRQLSLTYKFMPANAQESQTCYDMIQTIREHAYPNLVQGITFEFPDIFRIQFGSIKGGDAKMIQFADAYCTSVSVNYGASGPAFFPDASPAEIDLTLSFQETEVHSRQSIRSGGF